MAVYVDDAFLSGDWGRWNGGGHMQADTEAELHAFAGRLGMRRAWFQDRPRRPEFSHYDLDRDLRDVALANGAIAETIREGSARRRAARERRRAAAVTEGV